MAKASRNRPFPRAAKDYYSIPAIHGGPLEAEGYRWANVDEVRGDSAAMPERYSIWFRYYVAAQ